MKRICFVFAMRAEAQPLIAHYNLQWQRGFFAPLPCQLYKASPDTERADSLFVVVNGTQGEGDGKRDLIGCEPAAVTTMAAIERLHPDIVICSGTCGGWMRYGAKVAHAYIGNGVMFHDRRVPGDNAWATQGLGNYPVWEGSEAMAKALGMEMGKVTTGSSFEMSPEEEQIIDQNGGRLKEMEGAAVGFVCSLFSVPVVFIKVVTNLRDAEEEDMDAFQRNLKTAALVLLEANVKVIEYLSKCD